MTIEINGIKFPLSSNAFTYIRYSKFFNNGIIEDINFIKKYLAMQAYYYDKYQKEGKSEEECIELTTQILQKDMSEFIEKIFRLTWIMIYTANENTVDYNTWLKSISGFKITDKWIAEVAEYVIETF